jgi:hypothetical protein
MWNRNNNQGSDTCNYWGQQTIKNNVEPTRDQTRHNSKKKERNTENGKTETNGGIMLI